jgi:hypothetical protein
MSIFQIETVDDPSCLYAPYIESIALELMNIGMSPYEALIMVIGPGGVFYQGLYSLPSGVPINIEGIGTGYTFFKLMVITNTNNYYETVINLRCHNQGQLLAVYTQEQMQRDY